MPGRRHLRRCSQSEEEHEGLPATAAAHAPQEAEDCGGAQEPVAGEGRPAAAAVHSRRGPRGRPLLHAVQLLPVRPALPPGGAAAAAPRGRRLPPGPRARAPVARGGRGRRAARRRQPAQAPGGRGRRGGGAAATGAQQRRPADRGCRTHGYARLLHGTAGAARPLAQCRRLALRGLRCRRVQQLRRRRRSHLEYRGLGVSAAGAAFRAPRRRAARHPERAGRAAALGDPGAAGARVALGAAAGPRGAAGAPLPGLREDRARPGRRPLPPGARQLALA
mmetsp:Transcript_91624/g.290704  ORF Transcript_91624/g.290704 Transcript_91624/m.290704 type:complete len:278 (+) Transcript_91624:293-1126(+)